jgi:branched-chain amino acid transport system substrate-binding protein
MAIDKRKRKDEMKVANILRNAARATTLAGVASATMLIGPTAAAQDIAVGVVMPITGVLAAYGTPYAEAARIAVDDVNAKGGINGRKIKLVVEDSQASNTVAINAVNKVLQSNPVAIIGPGLGTQIMAIMPITEREKVPLVAGPSTRRVTQQGAKYFFRGSSHDAIDKENGTRFLVETLGKKKIGIMHVANEWGYSGRDNTIYFLDKLYGLKPVSVASYQPTDKDLTAQILQMKRDGAEAIVVQGHPVDEALAMRQIRQLDVQAAVVGSGTTCSAFLRDLLAPADIAGRYCNAPTVMSSYSSNAKLQEFAERYKKKVGIAPDPYVSLTYESMGMLIEVMKKYGADREKIRQGLSEMTYNGIGGTFKSDKEGNLWHSATMMEFLPDGKVKVVRRHEEKF